VRSADDQASLLSGVNPRMLRSDAMSTARRLHHSYEHYLRALEHSTVKLEYCDGEIYAMAGGTPAHAERAASVIGLLRNALRGRCRVFSSDLKIRIDATDFTTFPDVSVVCGEDTASRLDKDAITNPTLLVEVTSESTEDYDRGNKLSHYKQIGSLAAVMFVSHKRPSITVVRRAATGWQEAEFRAGETATLEVPAVAVSIDEVYASITLDRER
jgi:Uma2 family endonuclease